MNKTKVLNIRLSETEYKKIKELADKENRGMSDYIRLKVLVGKSIITTKM